MYIYITVDQFKYLLKLCHESICLNIINTYACICICIHICGISIYLSIENKLHYC